MQQLRAEKVRAVGLSLAGTQGLAQRRGRWLLHPNSAAEALSLPKPLSCPYSALLKLLWGLGQCEEPPLSCLAEPLWL